MGCNLYGSLNVYMPPFFEEAADNTIHFLNSISLSPRATPC